MNPINEQELTAGKKSEWVAPMVKKIDVTMETRGGPVGPDDGLGGAGFS